MGFRGFVERHFGFIRGNYLVLLITKSYPRAAYFLYYPFRQKYFLLLGGSTIALGWMSGARNLVNSLVQVPGGHFADKIGRRRILVIGHFLTGIGWILRGLAPDWRWFFLVQMFMAAVYFYRIADEAALMDSLPPENRGIGITTLNMAIGIASLLSPFIGGALLDAHGIWALRTFLFASGILDMTQGIVFSQYLKETVVPEEPYKRERLTLRQLVLDPLRSLFESLRWMNKPLLGLAVLSTIYSFSVSVTMPFFTLYALDFIGLQGVQWGFVNSAESLIILLLRIPIGKTVDITSRRNLLMLGLAAEVASIFAFTRTMSFIPVLVIYLINSIAFTVTNPVSRRLRADHTPTARRGRVGSVFYLFNSVSMFLGSMLGGYLYSIDPGYPFLASGFFLLTGLLTTLVSIHDPEKPEE